MLGVCIVFWYSGPLAIRDLPAGGSGKWASTQFKGSSFCWVCAVVFFLKRPCPMFLIYSALLFTLSMHAVLCLPSSSPPLKKVSLWGTFLDWKWHVVILLETLRFDAFLSYTQSPTVVLQSCDYSSFPLFTGYLNLVDSPFLSSYNFCHIIPFYFFLCLSLSWNMISNCSPG